MSYAVSVKLPTISAAYENTLVSLSTTRKTTG